MSLTGGIGPIGGGGSGVYMVGVNAAMAYDGEYHSVTINGVEYDTGGLVVGPKFATVFGSPKGGFLSQAAVSATMAFPDAALAAATVQAQQGGTGTIGGSTR